MKAVMPDQLDEGLRFLIGDKRGRAVLKWILQKCDVEARVPCQDSYLAAYVESRRELGMELRKAICRSHNRRTIVDIEEEDHA